MKHEYIFFYWHASSSSSSLNNKCVRRLHMTKTKGGMENRKLLEDLKCTHTLRHARLTLPADANVHLHMCDCMCELLRCVSYSSGTQIQTKCVWRLGNFWIWIFRRDLTFVALKHDDGGVETATHTANAAQTNTHTQVMSAILFSKHVQQFNK